MNHQSKISLILSKIFFSFLLFISYALSAETYLDEKFTAKYDLKKSNITFGRNVNKLEKIGDTFKFEITASTAGIFKLKKDERFESSIFKIHNNEIKPSTYMFTRHLKDTVEVIATNFDVKENHGSFDNTKGCISYSEIKTETIKHEDSDCSAQDRLSVQIDYRKKLKSGKINTYNDHRIAMTFEIANIVSNLNLDIDNKECINISSPEFFNLLNQVLK